eukprot:768817-Hanusia_phi.AAC.5
MPTRRDTREYCLVERCVDPVAEVEDLPQPRGVVVDAPVGDAALGRVPEQLGDFEEPEEGVFAGEGVLYEPLLFEGEVDVEGLGDQGEQGLSFLEGGRSVGIHAVGCPVAVEEPDDTVEEGPVWR